MNESGDLVIFVPYRTSYGCEIPQERIVETTPGAIMQYLGALGVIQVEWS